MQRQSFQAGWAAIDRTGDPAAYIRFMDGLRPGKNDADPDIYRPIFDALAPQAGESLLDVGCGTGGAVRALATRVGEHGRVVGVDFSEVMIAEAGRRAAGQALPVEFQVADAQALPFADDGFDGCFALGVFEILPEPRRALVEMARVLRPGGRLVIQAPDIDATIIDAADRDVTRRFLHYVCDHEGNGWIGRQLPGFAHELGLVDVSAERTGRVLRDFRFVHQFWYRSSLANAVAAGALTEAEAEAWVADQEARQDAGRAFIGWAGFRLFARKRGA